VGRMKVYIAFLLLCSTAFAAVGEVTTENSVSDSTSTGSSAAAGLYEMQTSWGSSAASPALQWYSSGGSGEASSYGGLASGQGSSYAAPQISGPVQERMTADDLGLPIPQMESFVPDESLGFVPASPSGSAVTASAGSAISGSAYGSSSGSAQVQQSGLSGTQSYNWYYPGQVQSANRFFIETASGFKTAAGCSLYGYLPIWSDIRSSGYFFVYEWYPGSSSPSVSSWGWTAAGWKKGWFYADRPGWHTLCYNSGFWSNYIYIYVYPMSSGYAGSAAALSSGAPVPPNPASENIVMPDYSQYRPVTGQTAAASGSTAAQGTAAMGSGSLSPATANPALRGIYSGTAGGALPSSTTTAAASATYSATMTESSFGIYSSASGCPTCIQASQPSGYIPQSYQVVYPLPSVCKCNEYYVQICTGKLGTVAGVFCGDWMALWSKISRPGEYWSYEWTPCPGGSGRCWTPEAKSFGLKTAGWHQTWFKGNKPGWHILSYHCNDWSNYIYIYVWPDE